MSGRRPAGGTELLVAAGFVAVVGGCLLATAIFPPGQTMGRIVVLAVVLAVFAAWATDVLAALATAVMGWLVATGFLVGREGELRFTGVPDLLRIATLVAAVAAGLGWGFVRRNILAEASADAATAEDHPRGHAVGAVISQGGPPARACRTPLHPRRTVNGPPHPRV
jgi:hypothetical protein